MKKLKLLLSVIFVIVCLDDVHSQIRELPFISESHLNINVQKHDSLGYLYSYQIFNGINSKGDITLFEIDARNKIHVEIKPSNLKFKDELTKNSYQRMIDYITIPTVPLSFYDFPDYYRASLSSIGFARFSTPYVTPGKSAEGFIIYSIGIPGIRTFISHPKYSPRDYYPSVDDPNSNLTAFEIDSLVTLDQERLKYYGDTIGPWLPDSSLSSSAFTDTLETFLYRSCEELDWITNKGICNSLEVKLNNVQKHLDNGSPEQAANVLHAFIHEVNAQKDKALSSEAYALLYYNGSYLLSKINDEME